MATEKEMEIVEGSVENIEFKPNKRGNQFVEVAIQQVGFEHLTRPRSTNADIMDRLGNAKKHLDAGETVHLGVEVTKTPTPSGNGYYRDIVRITSASIGDVAQEPPTPGSSTSAAPTSSPTAWGSKDDNIRWNSSMNNGNHATKPPENIEDEARWMDDIVRRAGLFYVALRKGYTPPEEDTPDADQPEESDDGVFEA